MTAAGKLWKLAGELRRLERERRRALYRKRVARRLLAAPTAHDANAGRRFAENWHRLATPPEKKT